MVFDRNISLFVVKYQTRASVKLRGLNEAIVKLVEDFEMVEFLPLDASDRDSVEMMSMIVLNRRRIRYLPS
jgi:hypothetical protein